MRAVDKSDGKSPNLLDSPKDYIGRSSNIELLRIVAMLMIVAHHFAVHGGFSFGIDAVTLPRLWVQLLESGGKIGVNIFVLISGYFLICSQKIKISGLVKLWLRVFFYSAAIYGILMVTGLESFKMKEFIKAMFPVVFEESWFATFYFALYLLSPFMNKLLIVLDQKSYQKLLAILFVMWCIVPTFTNRGPGYGTFQWFVFLYMVAGYIRLWHDSFRYPSAIYYAVAMVTALLIFASIVVFDVVGTKIAVVGEHAMFFCAMPKLPVLIVSVTLFIGFKNLRIPRNKFINGIAATTFGVYLIHDNIHLREILWLDVFRNSSYGDTALVIPYSIGVICVVFAGCAFIESLRLKFIEHAYLKIIKTLDVYTERFQQCFFSFMEKSKL